jgi:hypothetical protein
MLGGQSDPYCKVYFQREGREHLVHTTKVAKKNLSPAWDELVEVYLPYYSADAQKLSEHESGKHKGLNSIRFEVSLAFSFHLSLFLFSRALTYVPSSSSPSLQGVRSRYYRI